jgi:ABC-2 type transport system permease protein
MNTFPMLVRREFWEHRSLWIAPLIWVGIIVVIFTALLFIVTNHPDVRPVAQAESIEAIPGLTAENRDQARHAMDLSDERKQSAFPLTYLAIWGLISGFASVVVFFYLIDCLYSERRDRSILFWKSLPVSDLEVVLSKFVVALILVPVGAVLLAAATQVVLYLVVWLRFHGTVIGDMVPDWSFIAWLRSQAIALGVMLGGIMWYAPIAAYLLMLSVWARRLVILWAILPLMALPALEGIFLHSTHVLEFLAHRFAGYMLKLHVDPVAFQQRSDSADVPRVQDVFNSLDMSGIFTSLETWIGIAAAAAMIFVTVRIRRYRDDS